MDYTLSEKSSVTSESEKIVCMEACVGDITETCEFVQQFYGEGEVDIQCEKYVGENITQEADTMRGVNNIPEGLEKYAEFGCFMIHYDSSSNTTPIFISSLGAALLEADASLVGGLSLARPTGHMEDTKYHIYVVNTPKPSNNDDDATCYSYINESGARVSYIVFYEITNLSAETTLSQKGNAAHEYMHAITHTYRSNLDLPSWFKEAWANWAAVRVQGINSREVNDVNQFLNNPYKAFKTDEYKYGKFLLPLFIGQNYGGDITVANVIKNLATTANVEVAISNALPLGKTFQSIFPDFMGFNYAPKYFYTTYASGWSNRPYISESYAQNAYPNDDYCQLLNPYATNYREFSVPLEAPYDLDITIRAMKSDGVLAGRLHMKDQIIL